jgi:Rad3-related DNA helicase
VREITASKGIFKGKKLWDSQVKALNFITNSSKRFICLRAPTGSGKSLIGMEALDSPLFYLCSSIELQEQLLKDFPELVLLKGRNNYPCISGLFESVELCIKKPACHDCLYYKQKRKLLSSQYGVLNFHYFLNLVNFAKKEKKIEGRNIVIDEADVIETILVDLISFEFSFERLKRLGFNLGKPEKKTVVESFVKWIQVFKVFLDDLIENLASKILDIQTKIERDEELLGYEQVTLKRWNNLKNLEWKVKFLLSQDLEDNWIYYYNEKKISLKPKWLTRELTDRFLFNHGKKFLLMSATLPSKPVLCGLFGLEPDEVDYIDLESSWDITKKPVFYIPKYSISHKTRKEVKKKVRDAVSEVLEKEKERGLIHTVSYYLADYLKGLSSRLIFHDSKDKKRQFQKFISTPGAVFVSPSSARGLDLKDDLCRWIVLLKAPFPDLSDKQVSARLYGSGKFGKLWYQSQAVETIIQACGRANRHADDWATVYLYDEQIGRLLKEHKGLFPLWFRELIIFKKGLRT